jgi:CheY-like chemotaxis protein/chromosome segregation ATPase
MPTKVLVFESDSAFAGELRSELGKLGCATTVVDDGNVGLQQAGSDKPDLILLSIELPRMNGFSVCNKLKKDPGLKDVPLIIMSSESSDETFEQHKKLRTRAEDYVHKPIAFGELLQHIKGFVAIEGETTTADSEGAIVIDEEIEVGNSDYLIEDDVSPGSKRAESKRPEKKVDADIDAFAESAFGRLEAPSSEVRGTQNGTPAEARAAQQRSVPPPPRNVSIAAKPPPTQAPAADHAELQRLRDDLAHVKGRAESGERELEEVRREADKLRLEAGEAERLGREVDELKTKIASSPKGGGVSSRDFLDLREALNKKDKEILSLKEQLSKKDKEIVDTQDKMLVLERGKADLDDRLIVLERELDGTKEKAEALASDKELAKKTSDDFKARFEKTKSDVDAKERQLAELRAKSSSDLAAAQARLEAERADADQTLANERAEQARLVDQAEERRSADVEQARRDAEAALVEAREKAEGEKGEALSAQAAQLRQEHEARVTDVKREHEQSLDRARAEAKEAATSADTRREEDLAAARREAEQKLDAARAEAQGHEETALEALKSELLAKTVEIENDRDARIANLEAKASRELGEANDKLAKVDVDFSAVRGELESLRESKRSGDEAAETKIASLDKKLTETESARAALDKELSEKIDRLAAETVRADKSHMKWESDKQSLERAKDALAVALSQIEEAEGRS